MRNDVSVRIDQKPERLVQNDNVVFSASVGYNALAGPPNPQSDNEQTLPRFSDASFTSSSYRIPVTVIAPMEGARALLVKMPSSSALGSRVTSPKTLIDTPTVHPTRSAWMTATASLAAAVSTCALLHPLDLIKTRMQVSGMLPSDVFGAYTSTRISAKHIIKQEGIVGLYKGLSATVIASGISWGIFRYVYDLTRLNSSFLFRSNYVLPDDAQPSLRMNLTAGMIAGLVSTILVHPLWLVKTQIEMQAAGTRKIGWVQYQNWRHCISSIFVTSGLGGLYRGIGPAISLVPHAALQVCVYEELKRRDPFVWSRGESFFGLSGFMATNSEDAPPDLVAKLGDNLSASFRPFLWGAVSKFVAVTITYPLQVLRARQQMVNSPLASTNFLRVAVRIVEQEGFRALYGGFCTHIQRACIYNGLMFFLYEHMVGRQSRLVDDPRTQENVSLLSPKR